MPDEDEPSALPPVHPNDGDPVHGAQDSASSDESDEEDDSDGEPVESLVQGRDRRSTQANRYSSLLEQETAGEDGDDEIALLFAEADEEDVEFEDPDAVDTSDAADDDSSTDDEDQGPTAGDDELEGEVQLKKEERAAKRAEKRKTDKLFVKPPPARKKVKIDESATTSDAAAIALADRKRKMSERISWLPTGPPARTSSRTLSVQNKVRTMASMKESASRRIRQIAIMEAAQRRKDANKAKPMTQAERMAEAAETERVNSQSLNRWEEAEAERKRKQKARLDAMQNRKIEGPLIRWYSAKGEWVDGKLKRIGKHLVTETVEDKYRKDGEPKKRTWKRKIRPQDGDGTKDSTQDGVKDATPAAASTQPSGVHTKESSPSNDKTLEYNAADDAQGEQKDGLPETPAESKQQSETIYEQTDLSKSQTDHPNIAVENSFGGIEEDGSSGKDENVAEDKGEDKISSNDREEPHEMSEMIEDRDEGPDELQGTPVHRSPGAISESNEQTPNLELPQDQHQIEEKHDKSGNELEDSSRIANMDDSQNISAHVVAESDAQPTDNPPANSTPDPNPQFDFKSTEKPATEPQSETQVPSDHPKIIEYGARNIVTLQNFDQISLQDISVLRHAVMGTPLPKNFTMSAPSSRANASAKSHQQHLPHKVVQPMCAITGHPAKYRDPATGLPYANLEAYRAIRKLMDSGCVWSGLLGAWVGGAGDDEGRMLADGGGGIASGVSDGIVTRGAPVAAQISGEARNANNSSGAAVKMEVK